MATLEELDIAKWAEQPTDDINKEFREAVHTILAAISDDEKLRASMVLKGGILLAVRYHSHRYTTDIDLSTEQKLGEQFSVESVRDSLNQSLAITIESLDYNLDCRVQSAKQNPKNSEATHPSINLKVGYAYKGTDKHKRLVSDQGSPTAISIDYSLNEAMQDIDQVKLVQGNELNVYSITDLIAEKFRSLLQQVPRERFRRQDVFDLFLIFENFDDFDYVEKHKIHTALLFKSKARGIIPTIDSIDEPELKSRAMKDYSTLRDEIEGAVSYTHLTLPTTPYV